jgi:hypothetical protein
VGENNTDLDASTSQQQLQGTHAQGKGKVKEMRWNHYLSYFFGGAFLVNAIPHFVSGVTGHPFQSPFATPPGQGLSSAMINVLWGAFNLVICYLLVCRVGTFELRRTRHAVVAGVGALLMALMLARSFGRFYGGV